MEVTRRDRPTPAERAFWDPILARVEAVIAQMLAARDGAGRPDFEKLSRLDREIDAIYFQSMSDYATRRGLTMAPTVLPAPQAPAKASPLFFDVTLTTAGGQGMILLAPLARLEAGDAPGGGDRARHDLRQHRPRDAEATGGNLRLQDPRSIRQDDRGPAGRDLPGRSAHAALTSTP